MSKTLRFLAAAAFAVIAALSSPAARADVFLVTDIEVDVVAENSVDAQRLAFAEARLEAAQKLMRRLTLSQDRAAAGGLYVDAVTASRLAAAVDIQEQKRSGTRFFGVLSVKFDPNAVRGYLQALDVPFTESAAASAVLAPIVGAGVDPVAWIGAWSELETDHGLIPFRLGYSLYDASSRWDDFTVEAAQLSATRGLLARADMRGESIYVDLSEIRPDGVSRIGRAGPYASLEEASVGAVSYLQGDWKQRTTVRGGDQTAITAIARYGTLSEWVSIKSALEQSPLVGDILIRSVMTGGADVSFLYAGRPDQLATELQARGVDFAPDDEGWTLAAAGAQ